MAHLRTKKLKSGTAYEIIYRQQGQRKSLYFPPGSDKNIVLAAKKKLEAELLLQKSQTNNRSTSAIKITLDQFISWYQSQRQHQIASTTLKRYILALRNFSNIIGTEFFLNQISTEHINQFKIQRLEMGATKQGINKDLHHLKHPFKLAREYGFITNQIKIEKFKTHQPLPDILTPEEIDLLSQHIPRGECQLAFEILKWTGIRRSELALRCYKQDFNFKTGYLVIHGKNYDDRIVPIHPQLKSYLETNPIFNSRSSTDKLLKICVHHISHGIQVAKKRAGINKKGNTHLLRHSLGTYLLNNGFDLREVQEILGHKTLYMTIRYTQIIKEQLKTKFNKIAY